MKKKIAILGGGPAALATAFELTNFPGHQDYFDITVYQLGWRLGGKCATGRGVFNRIEEHGIHVFLGWYDNTFRMVRQAYAERNAAGKGDDAYFRDWKEGFLPGSSILLNYYDPGAAVWRYYPLIMPESPGKPGRGKARKIFDLWKGLIPATLEMVFGPARPRLKQEDFAVIETLPAPRAGEKYMDFQVIFYQQRNTWKAAPGQPQMIADCCAVANAFLHLDAKKDKAGHLHLKKQLDGLLQELKHWIQEAIMACPFLYVSLTTIEFMLGLVKGCWPLIDIWNRTIDLDKIEQLDFRRWIQEQGVSALTLHCPVMKFAYNGTFSYPGGNDNKGGALSARAAVLGILLQFVGCKGARHYFFKAGTAEVYIAPVYQALVDRGVKFSFFNQVEKITTDAQGRVSEIQIGKQVTLTNPPYQPLKFLEFDRKSNSRTLATWPAEPLYDQIDPAQAKKLQEDSIDLESHWSSWKPVGTRTLKVGDHFDDVVLGVSIAGLTEICADIIQQSKAWKSMMDNIQTVQTQSMQVWLGVDAEALGFSSEQWRLPVGQPVQTTTYAAPFTSLGDFSFVMEAEDWAGFMGYVMPKAVLYFTGVLAEVQLQGDTAFPPLMHQAVKYTGVQYLRSNLGYFLPKATTIWEPQGVDLGLLAGPVGLFIDQGYMLNLDMQYYRANINPSDRYVLAVPGSGRFRLSATESGIRNLYLAGDWTKSGYNFGCVEAAVVSGLLAAQAIMLEAKVPKKDIQAIKIDESLLKVN